MSGVLKLGINYNNLLSYSHVQKNVKCNWYEKWLS